MTKFDAIQKSIGFVMDTVQQQWIALNAITDVMHKLAQMNQAVVYRTAMKPRRRTCKAGKRRRMGGKG